MIGDFLYDAIVSRFKGLGARWVRIVTLRLFIDLKPLVAAVVSFYDIPLLL